MKFSVGDEGNTQGSEGEGGQLSGVVGPGGTVDSRKCWVPSGPPIPFTEEPA